MSDIKPTDIVIPVAVYNDMQKKIEHLNADARRKGKALAKAVMQLDAAKEAERDLNAIIARLDKPQDDLLRDALKHIDELKADNKEKIRLLKNALGMAAQLDALLSEALGTENLGADWYEQQIDKLNTELNAEGGA